MFKNGDTVDFEIADEMKTGVVVQTYEVPYLTVMDFTGERFYVSANSVVQTA